MYHKNPVVGGALDLRRIPAHAGSIIVHTRMGTHGSEADNRNNHPVVSPDRSISLVHNGVIWNHDELRDNALMGYDLPDVDSSVLPALLQRYGVQGFEKIAGDAAVIWMSADTGRVIHLARLEHSPFTIAKLSDGSLVGASTVEILANAVVELADLGITLTWVRALEELEYLTILDGEILTQTMLNSTASGNYHFNPRSWRGTTSGKTGGIGSEFGADAWDEDDDYDGWEEAAQFWEDPDEDIWAYQMRENMATATGERFYVTDNDGNDITFPSAFEMLAYLQWFASREPRNAMWPDAGDEEGWINWFCDLGEIDRAGGLLSWIRHPDLMEQHEVGSGVRDGAEILKNWGIV